MEASKVTVGAKTYDLNHIRGNKRKSLRRKMIVEYIESKPAGEIISLNEIMNLGRWGTPSAAYTFIKNMVRDGVIGRYEGDKPHTYYYSVIGSARVKQPAASKQEVEPTAVRNPNIGQFISDMQRFGVEFTITITNAKA